MFFECALIGATASGKSALAIELAKVINGVILSLDSLACYKKIDIASAKPTQKELESVRHFGINLVYPDAKFNVVKFIDEYKIAKNYAQKRKIPLIITGGSSFYLNSMLKGLVPYVKPSNLTLSNDEIWELILKIDPLFSAKFSKNDSYRLNRWLDIYTATKQIPTQFLKEQTQKPTIEKIPIYEIKIDRAELRDKIKQRTKEMIGLGLLDEAKMLFDEYGREHKALKSIGLKECGDFFDGKIKNEDELIELISTHTAQLAKRQTTFNRSQFKDKFSGDKESITKEILRLREANS